MDVSKLRFISAPMVNQSDAPFRILTQRYGATLAYSQMLIPDRILNDCDYFEYHMRDLCVQPDTDIVNYSTVVQLCGNDPETIVQAGRKLQGYCDGIDLNLGCPQETARDNHFGAYLLGRKDWPLIEQIVSSMTQSLSVPVSAKMRLCQPFEATTELGQMLEANGASWITLHARTVSSRRRRQGAAELSEVKRLKEALNIPAISNGNVRVFSDVEENLAFTGADGVMVGETLLGNPCLFTGKIPDPVDISLEYLELCRRYRDITTLSVIHTHIRHFIQFQCNRRPWFPKFRTALAATKSLDEIEKLLTYKVERWRGRLPRPTHRAMAGREDNFTDTDTSSDKEKETVGDLIDLTLIR